MNPEPPNDHMHHCIYRLMVDYNFDVWDCKCPHDNVVKPDVWPAGTLVKVVMCSRLGDVGITKDLKAERGYQARVKPEVLQRVGSSEMIDEIIKTSNKIEAAGSKPSTLPTKLGQQYLDRIKALENQVESLIDSNQQYSDRLRSLEALVDSALIVQEDQDKAIVDLELGIKAVNNLCIEQRGEHNKRITAIEKEIADQPTVISARWDPVGE